MEKSRLENKDIAVDQLQNAVTEESLSIESTGEMVTNQWFCEPCMRAACNGKAASVRYLSKYITKEMSTADQKPCDKCGAKRWKWEAFTIAISDRGQHIAYHRDG